METFNGLPVLKISIDDDENHGVDKISLVNSPAFQEQFFSFQKEDSEEEVLKFEVLEQQKLAGALLIPDVPILRKHPETGQKFYVIFPKEVIQQIAERFNENQFGGNFNEQHSEDQDLKDVFVSENWIIESTEGDKAFSKFGFSYPVGTWFGIVKVKDEELWNNKIKTEELRGFSVEMLAGLKFSIDAQLIESFALESMEGLGEEIPEGAKLISVEDILENENEFGDEELRKILNFNIKAEPTGTSSLDRLKGDEGKWIVRYKYTGIKDSKNRNFCRKVLNYQTRTKRVFRREDIAQMSFRGENSKEFGFYSIFNYKGSFGCRHLWKRLIFFIDFEDDETRRVGNVYQVTRGINDVKARRKNPEPKRSKLSKIDVNMSDENLKFATLEELTPEERVENAQVDNADGDYTLDGVVYTVTEGVITAIAEAEAPANEEAPENEESPEENKENADEMEAFKMEVMAKIAELESKVEELTSKLSGDDESSQEQFSKVELEAMFTKFAEELRPANVLQNENQEAPKPTSKVESVVGTIDKMRNK
jgi:hypothetical protein